MSINTPRIYPQSRYFLVSFSIVSAYGAYILAFYFIELISYFCNLFKFVLLSLGIDVLSSGYDAASWTTKYKIFDFSEEGDVVHVNSINKTYIAPAMVNVITDGMNSKRVEDSCIDVVTHFEGKGFTLVTDTVEPGDSKPVDSKLLALVNFLPLTNSFIT